MSSTALRTLVAVRSFSLAGALKNRDTVAVETPAAAATSLMVALLGGGRERGGRRVRGCLDFERLEAGIALQCKAIGRAVRCCAVSNLSLALTSEMQAFTK
jgi:hypothetical protein